MPVTHIKEVTDNKQAPRWLPIDVCCDCVASYIPIYVMYLCVIRDSVCRIRLKGIYFIILNFVYYL